MNAEMQLAKERREERQRYESTLRAQLEREAEARLRAAKAQFEKEKAEALEEVEFRKRELASRHEEINQALRDPPHEHARQLVRMAERLARFREMAIRTLGLHRDPAPAPSVEYLSKILLISIHPFLLFDYDCQFKDHKEKRPACFHLMGIDILLDEKCKPWTSRIPPSDLQANSQETYTCPNKDKT